MRNQKDIDVCLNILKNKFAEINQYYKELLVASEHYPLISFETVYDMISKIQESPTFKQFKIPKA